MARHAAQSAKIDELWLDPLWRLNTLYTITDKSGVRVPFRLNKSQAKLFQEMKWLNVILKARQLGFTTFICLLMLDACIFNSDTRAGIIAHNQEDAEAFFRDKIKFAYDNLDPAIKAVNPAMLDSAKTLSFKNNSQIRVGTSLRSGTNQYLLVSEFGKICARYPNKANEIISGAFNTVQVGQMIFVESTAEGKEGHFYAMCQSAKHARDSGKKSGKLDFRFHFCPWHDDPGYVLSPDDVVLTVDDDRYFKGLADKGVMLTREQMAWYAAKSRSQLDMMNREYPSTPEEAFEAAVEGAYFATQMGAARRQGRIGKVPFDPRLPVNTFWDLGMNDSTVIWLHQRHNAEQRFIGYHENSGEGFAYYAHWLQGWATERQAIWGKHFAPHDIEVRSIDVHAKSRKDAAKEVGIAFETVPRVTVKEDAIESARGALSGCWFDEAACSRGIAHLDQYRKSWNDALGVWRNEPRHDDASHGADAFQTFAVAESHGMVSPTAKPTALAYKTHRGLA